MKNKRYKRIAKRLKGNCLRNCRKYKPCNECKESSKLFFKNTITIKKDKLYKLINSLDKTLLKLGKSDTGDLQFCMEDEFNEVIKSINKLKEELGYDKTYSKDYYFYGEEEA